jgi:hypothetical protein
MQRFTTRRWIPVLLAVFSSLASAQQASDKPQGFTCCNLRYEKDWISDINYAYFPMLPLGQPATVTSYGRYRAIVQMGDRVMRLGNDYSRDLSNEAFAKKWIVTQDPKIKLATFPADIQDAIKKARVKKGMTKEQVIMSLGHPVTSENPDLNASVWRYWLSSFDEYQIVWDEQGIVKDIRADALSMPRILP